MATKKTETVEDQVDVAVDDVDDGPHPLGSLVRLPNHHDRYAIVVGYTDPVEEHVDKTGGRVQAAPHGHPLLLDLPGTPREHQSGTERL